jgi:hypothetical protein
MTDFDIKWTDVDGEPQLTLYRLHQDTLTDAEAEKYLATSFGADRVRRIISITSKAPEYGWKPVT